MDVVEGGGVVDVFIRGGEVYRHRHRQVTALHDVLQEARRAQHRNFLYLHASGVDTFVYLGSWRCRRCIALTQL